MCFKCGGHLMRFVVIINPSILEGAESTVIMASGMCASVVLFMALVPAGGHLVTTTDCYRKTRIFIETFLPKMGITVNVLLSHSFGGLIVFCICCMGQKLLLMLSRFFSLKSYLTCLDFERMLIFLWFNAIWLLTKSYHKMNLKWVCILRYMNELSLIWITHSTCDSLFYYYFLNFSFSNSHEKLNGHKFKLLNEKELKEHFGIYPIWLFHYFLSVTQLFNVCTHYSIYLFNCFIFIHLK